MNDRQLLTLDENSLIQASQEYAKRIDVFLIQREKSVLSKLIAIGGALEEESFEIQAKISLGETTSVIERISQSTIEIIRQRHYREYDIYFSFDDPEEGYLRYREDHFIGSKDEITQVRTRLTLIGPSREHQYPQRVLLSRSRFIAPATESLRFYREYFKARSELEIEKDRKRFLVKYKDTEFFINIDTVSVPDLGAFLEIKSRTWSRQDAELKSNLIIELITFLGASPEETISADYIKMVENNL